MNMKMFLFLITFYVFAAGCGSQKSAQQHIEHTPIAITKPVPVEVTGTVEVPGVTYQETSPVDPATGGAHWDWPEASTTVTPREGGVMQVTTTVKPKTITVTLRDTVLITLRDTIEIEIQAESEPIVLPALPSEGTPISGWLLWGFGALAAFLLAFFARRKAKR
jgi:hypothetical protein